MAQYILRSTTKAPDPRPQKADIMHAWTDRHILMKHAERLVVNPAILSKYQDLDGLLYKWFMKTCRYRNERLGKTTAMCFDMVDNKQFEIGLDSGIDVNLYIARRKASKKKPLWCKKLNGSFQSNREIWFSESKLFTKDNVHGYWDDTMANDGKDKADYKYLKLNPGDCRSNFAYPVVDFDDTDAGTHEQSVSKVYKDFTAKEKANYISKLEFEQEEPGAEEDVHMKFRKHQVPLDALDYTAVPIDDILNDKKVVDVDKILKEENDIIIKPLVQEKK